MARESHGTGIERWGPNPRGGGEVIRVVMSEFNAPVVHVGTFKGFDSVKDRSPTDVIPEGGR